jgi:hypothetical protein
MVPSADIVQGKGMADLIYIYGTVEQYIVMRSTGIVYCTVLMYSTDIKKKQCSNCTVEPRL